MDATSCLCNTLLVPDQYCCKEYFTYSTNWIDYPLYSYLPSSPVFLPVLPPAESVLWSPHITWCLSTPSPHTKNQPTNVWLLLHTGKHVDSSRLHMAVFHSHLVDFSAFCCFCVYVLCSQLPWEQKSPQDK